MPANSDRWSVEEERDLNALMARAGREINATEFAKRVSIDGDLARSEHAIRKRIFIIRRKRSTSALAALVAVAENELRFERVSRDALRSRELRTCDLERQVDLLVCVKTLTEIAIAQDARIAALENSRDAPPTY